MSNNDSERKFQYAIYMIVISVSFLCLFIYQWLETSHPLFASFFKDVGIAGVISILLTITIESFNRRAHAKAADRLLEKINKNLFEAVYKRLIPDEIFSEVEKCLLQSRVYRKNHKICYSIEAVPKAIDDSIDREKHVYCHAISTYEIHNTTDGKITHDVIMHLEKPINDQWNDCCKFTKAIIGDKELTPQEIEHATDKNDDVHVKFRYPIHINPRGYVRVKMEAELLKQTTDSEIWASKVPSNGLEIIVSSDDGELEISATANHNEKLEKSNLRNGTYKWELNHGIFPHQSVIFWWQKKC